MGNISNQIPPHQFPENEQPATNVVHNILPLLDESMAHAVFKDDVLNGVYGFSRTHTGVVGESGTDFGIKAFGPLAGLLATSDGDGVSATGKRGVVGESHAPGGVGVFGKSDGGIGVSGESKFTHGVSGQSHKINAGGVFGISDAAGPGVIGESPSGIGILGRNSAVAGRFEGNIEVTGNIAVNGDISFANADCAEEFDIANGAYVEPGSVMVLGNEGELEQSHRPYDKRVAGVISGAGAYKPGIVLDKQSSERTRQALALLGKVYCKVDAQYGAIDVGDLLTTSATKGHAMKADETSKPFGAIIGKALRPLQSGQGLIPILVALQ